MPRVVADNDLCTGCLSCQLFCSAEHIGGFNPKRARLFIHRDAKIAMNTVTICRQCGKPPCKTACDRNAINYNELHILSINREKCDGCAACIDACPFDAVKLDHTNPTALMCDLCTHRGAIDPQCVKACVVNALTLKGVG